MKIAGTIRVGRWMAIAALSAGLIGADGRGAGSSRSVVSPRMAGLPRLTVWAWERREDLRGVDARTTAVAYLDRTVVVNDGGVNVVPRRQAMLLPASTGLVRIAVVRIEVAPGTGLDAAESDAVARAIVEAVPTQVSGSRPAAPGSVTGGDAVGVLQVDFDARQSEREWYAGVLRKVRAEMPAGMPLSMTALASWCSYDGGWMRGLPVDEAVPMLFRMEPDRRRGKVSGWGAGDFAIREPLCAGSVGISTTEAWPSDMRNRRVHVFADRGWNRDGLEETLRRLQ